MEYVESEILTAQLMKWL